MHLCATQTAGNGPGVRILHAPPDNNSIPTDRQKPDGNSEAIFRAVIRFQQTAPRARINILLLSDECDVKAPVSVSLKRICVVHSPCATQHGEMAERIKAAVPKTAVHPVHRRFESYSHRQKTSRGYGGTGRRNGLRRRGRKTCRFESCYPHHDMYHWLSWIERRTTNAENGGSNPSWYATRRGCERPGADTTYPNHLLGWIRGVPEKRRATCRRTP